MAAQTLAGKRVILTRPPSRAAGLAARLQAAGAEVIFLPCIDFRPLSPAIGRDDLLAAFRRADWLIFTSVNAVYFFEEFLRRESLPRPAGQRLATVSKKTAAAAQDFGYEVDFCGPGNAAELAAEILAKFGAPKTVLFPCARTALHSLEERFGAAGTRVIRMEVYDTIPVVDSAAIARRLRRPADVLVFYSPSAVDAFWRACPQLLRPRIQQTPAASVGRTTAAALQKRGWHRVVPAERPDDEAVLGAVESAVASCWTSPEEEKER